MAAPLTLKKALEMAIQKEVVSRILYTSLSRRAREEAVKEACLELAGQEQMHQDILGKYLRGELKEGALSTSRVVDYKIAEHLEQPDVAPDMKLKDTFSLVAKRERASHEFYLGLARLHPAGEVKRLLEGLAGEERKHKQRVESLYTEVAFPQTDGG